MHEQKFSLSKSKTPKSYRGIAGRNPKARASHQKASKACSGNLINVKMFN